MMTITAIVGAASDKSLAERLHRLEHEDRVETLVIGEEDAARRRLRGTTDKGTDIAIALASGDRLADGAVLFIDASRAIVLRTAEPRWLRLTPTLPAIYRNSIGGIGLEICGMLPLN